MSLAGIRRLVLSGLTDVPRVSCPNCGEVHDPGGFVLLSDEAGDAIEMAGHRRCNLVDIVRDSQMKSAPTIVIVSPLAIADFAKLDELLDDEENEQTIAYAACFTPAAARLLAAELIALADEATRIEGGKPFDQKEIDRVAVDAYEAFLRRANAS